jgi:hypothetical protein
MFINDFQNLLTFDNVLLMHLKVLSMKKPIFFKIKNEIKIKSIIVNEKFQYK